jgi:CRP-like cAMP-binding protein
VATLQAGDVFGEKALLIEAPRTSNVRAKTRVDVLVMSRADFRTMVAQFPVLEAHFDALVKSRYPDLLPADARLKQRLADHVPLPR